MNNSASLSGKTALVTGGTTGIGRATAEAFIAAGASHVMITGQDMSRLEDARAALARLGAAEITALRWRAEEAGDHGAVAERVAALPNGIDVIFANAGVTWPAPLGQIDADASQKQFLVNVIGPLMLVQALAPHVNAGGSIIMNTSCLNVLGMPGMAVYAATKAALRSLVRTLPVELGDRDIRVNAVSPGPTETPIYDKLGVSEEDLAATAGHVPAGRFARPEELAGPALFLASDASSYLRGVEIPVDGGWSTL